MQGSSLGSQLTPLVVGVKLDNFSSNLCVTRMECVITKISRSQKISTCYAMHVLFVLEKTKQKGSIDPFGSYRVKKSCHYGKSVLSKLIWQIFLLWMKEYRRKLRHKILLRM